MKGEFLRVSMVADWLGVTKKRVYSLIQQGSLEAVRFGPRQTRIPRSSVDSLIERLARQHRQALGLSAEERL
ncbi:MAG: helix-turn-helix domain-containing protein [Candidatus Sumerlaeota bacterium]|nr:helix-turn-helix domain-containing protein [Candidatus Sumerlaeota bacterium]